MSETVLIQCPDCQGEGTVYYGKFAPRNDDDCQACDGAGRIWVDADDIEPDHEGSAA